MKKLTGIMIVLAMTFSLMIPAFADERVRPDLEAVRDEELAAFIADSWNEIYINPDYRLYIEGKDNPAELPIGGKHAFMVMGCQLENGGMQAELEARCDAAAAAAKAFPDSILICSGGATGDNNPERHTEAGLMKDYLIRTCGIDAERIITDEKAMTTLDNVVNTFAILEEQGIEAVTVVTSSYHQRRANILCRTLAEIIRKKEGKSIAVVGNYGCEVQPPERFTETDPWFAVIQLNAMLTISNQVS